MMNLSKENIQIQDFLNQVSKEYESSINSYSDELDSIRSKNLALFPKNFRLDKVQTDTYRALCTLSQSGISKSSEITSHRKYIGPVIVFFKKILNRVIATQFKNQFSGIEACMSRLITNQAKLEVEIKLSNIDQIPELES